MVWHSVKKKKHNKVLTLPSPLPMNKCTISCTEEKSSINLAKGFCRAKFWAKFPFWRGDVQGEVFGEVCGEVFHEVFGLVLLGHWQQKKLQQKLQPKIPMTLHSKTGQNSGKNFPTRFCRGTPGKHKPWFFGPKRLALALPASSLSWTSEEAGTWLFPDL